MQSDITNVVNFKIFQNFPKYFPNTEINIIDDSYHLYFNGNVFLVFSLEFNENLMGIRIHDVLKTFISGSEIFERLETIFKLKINEIKYIIVESDQSSINLSYENKNYKFSLSTLQILSKAESWYTSLGYKNETYSVEKNRWEYFNKMTFREFSLIQSYNFTYNNFKFHYEMQNYHKELFSFMSKMPWRQVNCDYHVSQNYNAFLDNIAMEWMHYFEENIYEMKLNEIGIKMKKNNEESLIPLLYKLCLYFDFLIYYSAGELLKML